MLCSKGVSIVPSGKCESSALLERAAHQVVGDLLVLTAAFAQVSVAATLSNMGQVLQAQGSYARARECYEESLQIRKAALGERHADVAVSLCCLGYVCQAEGRYEEALRYFEEDLQITKSALGDEHVSA